MKRLSIKVYAQHFSLEDLEEKGLQFADDSADHNNPDYLFTVLTNRQRQVAKLLDDGYTRKEIANDLQVCVQAIHQIVLRIRKRINDKAGVDTKHLTPRRLTEDTKNLIFMFMLTNPNLSVKLMHDIWDIHPLLKDYDKPSYQALKRYVKTI